MALGHPIFIWTGPDNDKDLLLPERCPLVQATPWLGWRLAVPVVALPPPPLGMGAGYRSIPHWKAAAIFAYPMYPDPTVPALLALTPLEICFRAAAWVRILGAYSVSGRLFATVMTDSFECDRRLAVEVAAIPTPPAGTLHPLAFTMADLDPTAQGYSAMGLGTPRPYDLPVLRFIHLLRLGDMLAPQPAPLLLLTKVAACLGSMFTRAGRQVAGCDALLGAEILAACIASANAGNRGLSDAAKAAKLPEILTRCFTDFPLMFRQVAVTARDHVRTVEKAVTFLHGRTED